MSNWIIHFLISNIFICIFTLVIIGTKKLTEKIFNLRLHSTILCFLLFLLLAVSIFSCTDSWLYNFFSWLHFFKLTQDLTLVPTRYPNLPVIHKIFC